MNEGARYVKIVEWSEEDQCLSVVAPGLLTEAATATTNRTFLSDCVRRSMTWSISTRGKVSRYLHLLV
jgi:hypothetical protein